MIRLEAPGVEADRHVEGKRVREGKIEIDQPRQRLPKKEHVVRKQVGMERATSIAMRPSVPGGRPPVPVSFVQVRPASSVFHNALPGPPPLKQHPLRRR